MSRYYGLDDQPVSMDEALPLFDNSGNFKRLVARTQVGKASVSTVHLRIDHNFAGEGPPLIYETMIFGGKHDQFQMRYSTRAEAEAGHAAVVRQLTDERRRRWPTWLRRWWAR